MELARSPIVQSVVASAGVLEFVASAKHPPRVADIARSLGLSNSQASRHVGTLVECGLLVRRSGGLRLGISLAQLAAKLHRESALHDAALPWLDHLSKRFVATSVLSVPTGIDAMVIRRCGSQRAHRLPFGEGMRVAATLWSCSWLTLAFAPDRLREAAVARRFDREPVEKDAPSAAAVSRKCERIRNRGYDFGPSPAAFGLWSISVPLLKGGTDLYGVVTIIRQPFNVAEATVEPYLGALQQAAGAIERKYRPGQSVGPANSPPLALENSFFL